MTASTQNAVRERRLADGIAPPLAHVDGWPVHLANLGEIVAAVTGAAERKEGFLYAPLNLDLLVKLRKDKVFADAMRRARFVNADGWPVAMLGRRQGVHIERLTGADTILPLTEVCARKRLPVYLFGTSPEVLARASSELQRLRPGLEIAGTESPPLGFDPHSAIADAAIDRIEASGAALCFLALGAPKQEILAARALERGVKVGFVCVGAGLDFIAGAQVRAPAVMRNHGMEWLWRVLTNPKRLGMRYASCALFLARITLLEPSLRRITGRA